MRLIDADALEKEGWSLHRTVRVDKYTSEYQVKQIAKVPTIEPEQAGKWILCSERLPEKYSDVLCCDTYGEYIIGMPYEDEESNTGFSVENDGVYMIDCIAWMPLPEPYCPNCGARMES